MFNFRISSQVALSQHAYAVFTYHTNNATFIQQNSTSLPIAVEVLFVLFL